jgi:hypothetical protein
MLAALALDCSTWYETTSHGSAFRSVKDFGAKGDGKTDDTKAVQAAIDHDVGSSLQKRAAVVYVPPGTYLLSDTLQIYWHTHVVGNHRCRPKLVLSDHAAGFGAPSRVKPLIATDNGFNRSTESPWWEDTVDKNMLFFAQIHHIALDLGNNPGAVGVLWAVAQQTSLRNLSVAATAAYSGIDVGYPGGYAAPVARPTPGGGGTVEDVEVSGGLQFGVRVSASQWLLRAVAVRSAAIACIALPNEAWSITLLDVHARGCPVGVATYAPLGFLTLLDSTFDGSDGRMEAAIVASSAPTPPAAPVADAARAASTAPPPPPPGLILSHVRAMSLAWVVRGTLPGPRLNGTAFVDSWRLAGTVVVNGVEWRNDSRTGLELPRTRLPPPTGTVPRRSRPTLSDAHLPPPFNVRDAGARGDGATDDARLAVGDHAPSVGLRAVRAPQWDPALRVPPTACTRASLLLLLSPLRRW